MGCESVRSGADLTGRIDDARVAGSRNDGPGAAAGACWDAGCGRIEVLDPFAGAGLFGGRLSAARPGSDGQRGGSTREVGRVDPGRTPGNYRHPAADDGRLLACESRIDPTTSAWCSTWRNRGRWSGIATRGGWAGSTGTTMPQRQPRRSPVRTGRMPLRSVGKSWPDGFADALRAASSRRSWTRKWSRESATSTRTRCFTTLESIPSEWHIR